ncbi:MAG: ABC transporter permease [Promethearchaeota archaeon]
MKDLKAKKVRSIMAILGVSISIFLLSSVSFLTDSASAAYVDYLTTDSGNVDMDIHVRWVSGNQTQEPYWFDYNNMTNLIKSSNASNEIEGYLPRFIRYFSVNVSNSDTVLNFYFVGLNISYEDKLGFGGIKNTNYDFRENGLAPGNCAITQELADSLGVKVGDTLNISRWRYSNNTIDPKAYLNVTIQSIFTPVLMFPSYMTKVVVMDLSQMPYVMGSYDENWTLQPNNDYINKTNHLYLTLKDAKLLYDVRDITGSEHKVQAIADDVQFAIGYGYWVNLPKLENLGYYEYMGVATSVIFIFIGLISMLIASILINGILSTSVEERIREFGIFRTLGAHKTFNLKLVIYQGLLLCIFGTILGIFMAMMVVSKVVLPIATKFVEGEYISGSINFVARPESILLSFSLGVIVSMIVSISPAVKVMRIQIVYAINPYRTEENVYKIVREQGVNYKLLLFGLLLSINGGLIFFILPRLMLSMNMNAIASLMIIILLVFLVGMTMAGIGLMPLLLRLWMLVFTPFYKKIMHIIKVSIFRHERRNNSTILMFSLSFSFVMFTTSIIHIQVSQVSAMIEFNRGSPLVLYRTSSSLQTPTVELQDDLMNIEGVKRTSLVIANPNQLTQIYSENGKNFQANLGDYINLKSSSVVLYGVDNNYLDTVYTKFNHFTQGSMKNSFDQLFNGSNTCIISAALADDLSLELGDLVRMTFVRGDEQSIEKFIIVGIADKFAGFPQFKTSKLTGNANGVIISKDKYIEYMDIPNPAWVYKIFIAVRNDYSHNTTGVQQNINKELGDSWNFKLVNVAQSVESIQQEFVIVEFILQAILSFTIIICMFGLFAASYASVLERKREIAILRALGLRRKGVGRIFLVEALIIMLASGSMGTIVGFITAALLTEDLTLFTESPRLLAFPWSTTIGLFITTTIVLLIGMHMLLKRVKRQNLIEIFRETT